MAKRIFIRKGDIFCVKIEDLYKVFFQYVTNDIENLNSAVIRVFKKRYSLSEDPKVDSIVNDEVFFYAHTILRVGIKCGAWEKVGHIDDVGSLDNIFFRMYADGGVSGMTKSYRWYIWKVNTPHVFIGEMKECYRHYDVGWIYPYIDIVEKIKSGKFLINEVE